jgi:integrase
VPLTSRAKRLLELHFCTNESIGFTKRTAQRVVKRVANRAMISKPVTPHTMRHYAESPIMPRSVAAVLHSASGPPQLSFRLGIIRGSPEMPAADRLADNDRVLRSGV